LNPTPTPHPFEDSPDYIQSLARGLDVLRAFDQEHISMTLSEVAEITGLARAVARRCLLTLEHLGYVMSRGRKFSLTPKVLDLGFAYLSSLNLTEVAMPFMEQLAQRLQESCSMSVLDGQDIVYVARVPVRRVMAITLGVGARLPAFAASMGRVLVAGMPEEERKAWIAKVHFRALTPTTLTSKHALEAELVRVKAQGYALVQQELEPGLCSIAVPIRDRNQRPVAALNVGMQVRPGIKDHALKTVLPALKEAQASIERAMFHQWTGMSV
jgi:IclR family pca regulon transcriptional regulator